MSGVPSPPLSDAQADQVLAIVRQQLQLVLTSPTRIRPGQPLTAAVVPSSPAPDVSELRNGVPDLDFFVAVRTLDTDDDRPPETFPPGRVPRFEADPSGDDRWHTDMSSLGFHQSWLSGVQEEIKNPPPTPPLTCKPRVPPVSPGPGDVIP